MGTQARRLEKYSGITLGAVLVTAFVLAQPIMNQASAAGVEGLPGYDGCLFEAGLETQPLKLIAFFYGIQPEDPISMNTVRSGNIVKTIHAEKEIFKCRLDQGALEVIVDVTTYIELYENIADREVIASNAVAVTCLKDANTATVIDCESKPVPTDTVFVGNDCIEAREQDQNKPTHPQEMNTIVKGKIAKTIEAQKEVFFCQLGTDDFVYKKVDIVLFTEIYEDLSTQTITDVQFHSMRCVVLVSDDSDGFKDATVETCQFSTIEN